MGEMAPREDHSSGQWENFPAGLRVLVVDDDSLCLKVIEQMLRSCKYEVTTSITSVGALELLRDRKNDFDLVLSDVFMPDMDGFKLLGRIGLELDLPVIMMSSSGDTDVVLKGVTHGAVDFLIKPVRVEELRNVWQHMVRKRKDTGALSEQGRELDVEECGRREEGGGGDNSRKRKDICREGKGDDSYATKKPRVNWSVEMHQQFVNAVNELGIDKAVPKKILELMGVKGLTRENVASHLQKYRLYLKRLTGVQRAAGRSCSVPQAQAPQGGSESPATGLASAPLAAPPPRALFAGQLPGAPGFLGAMPQGMGSLLPTLGALSSNPNLTNMQLQLQNMTIQGGLPGIAGSLDANSVLQQGAVLPGGLGLGMGMNLQAQALMGMGLMAQGMQQDGNVQQQLQHLGMNRTSSAPVAEVANLANAQQLKRNHSTAVPSVGDGCAHGNLSPAGMPGANPSPLPPVHAMSGSAAQGVASMMAGLNHVPLPEALPYGGQQDLGDVPASGGAPLDLQVKQEDACGKRRGGDVAKALGPQGVLGAVDIVATDGFATDDPLLGVIGMDGELAALGNGDLAGFGDATALPLDEGKDTGMDEFLSTFLRDMSVPVGDGTFGQ